MVDENGFVKIDLYKESMTEDEFISNVFTSWGREETSLRLGIIGGFYAIGKSNDITSVLLPPMNTSLNS